MFISTDSKEGDSGGGRMSVALGGVRARVSGNRFGFFAKARPGVVSWSRAFRGVNVTKISDVAYYTEPVNGRRTDFAIDLGGGFEFYPNPRVALRTEFGNTLIRSIHLVDDPGFHNNLQLSTGVFLRTGNPVPRESRKAEEETHRFFDKTNIALHTLALSGIAADGIQTQRTISNWCSSDVYANSRTGCRAWYEPDPLVRPLVKYGWSGQLALTGITAGSELFLSHQMHRTGHHRLERIVPIAVAVAGGYMAYHWTKVHRPLLPGT
jgi:hypothetical protein